MILTTPILLLFVYLTQINASQIKTGTTFEIECPYNLIRDFSNVKNYAIILQNGQKNMEIALSYSNSDDIQKNCTLNKDKKMCVFTNYVNKIQVQCETKGSAILAIYILNQVSQIEDTQALRHHAILPTLQTNQKGILQFRPLDFYYLINGIGNYLEGFFISNCIQSYAQFQDMIEIGIKGSEESCAVILSQSVEGFWTFKKTQIYWQKQELIKAYLKPQQKETYQTAPRFKLNRFRIFFKIEDKMKLTKANVTIKTFLERDISSSEQSQGMEERQFVLELQKIAVTMPLRVAMVFSGHYILNITIESNIFVHYTIDFQQQDEIFELKQGQIFYYFYDKNKIDQVTVKAKFRKSFDKDKTLSTMLKKEGIQNMKIFIDEGQQKVSLLPINNVIPPINIPENRSVMKIIFKIFLEKSIQQNSNLIFFLIHFESTVEQKFLEIQQQYQLKLRKNMVEKFIIKKAHLQKIQKINLAISCQNCYVFATYNKKCAILSCCEQIHDQRIPNKKTEDLTIFLKAKPTPSNSDQTQIQTKFEINANDLGFKLQLQSGVIVSDYLFDSETYLFNRKTSQEVEIICYSDTESILLLVNTQNSGFPTKKQFNYQSNEGYLHLPASYMPIFITIIKMNPQRNPNYLPYSLVAVYKKDMIKLSHNQIFHDYINKRKEKQYLITHQCDMKQTVYFKISVRLPQSAHKKSIFLSFRHINNKTQVENQQIFDDLTFQITDLIKQSSQLSFLNRNTISKKNGIENEINNQCNIILKLKNPLGYSFKVILLHFSEKRNYQIINGEYNIDHFLSQKPLRLFCLVNASLPTNIYSYSLNQEIRMASKIVGFNSVPNVRQIYQSNNYFNYYYPQVQYSKQYTYSQYIRHQPISTLQSDDSANQLALVLIIIEKKTEKKTLQIPNFNKQKIFTICTQNKTQLNTNLKLYYTLNHQQTHTFSCKLGNDFYKEQQATKTTKLPLRQLLLQTSLIRGDYEIGAFIYNKTYNKTNNETIKFKLGPLNLNRKALTDQSINKKKASSKIKQQVSSYISTEPIIIIRSETIKAALLQYTKAKSLNNGEIIIEFELKCLNTNSICDLMTSLQTPNSDIRQLTPGIPEIFHLNKHSSIIFLYNNFLDDKMFKFKINRKKGFPTYQICSFKSDKQSNNDLCLSKLQKSDSDQMNLFEDSVFKNNYDYVIGRSHELTINQFSKDYCRNCVYYLALYSEYDIVEGSVFVMFANLSTIIEEGNSITTIVYRNHSDQYMIPDKSLYALIYQLDKPVRISIRTNSDESYIPLKDAIDILEDFNLTQILMYQKGEIDMLTNLDRLIKIRMKQDSKSEPFYLKIEPLGNLPSSLYTLISVSKQQPTIFVKDGVPYEMNSAQNLLQPFNFVYQCEGDGIIMVTSKDIADININITCDDQNQKAKNKNHNLTPRQTSKLSNRVDIVFSQQICKRYRLKINVKSVEVAYSVMASSMQIITLPFNKQIAGILKHQTKLYQIYQVSVGEKTQVRCVLKFCQGELGMVMISENKSSLYQQQNYQKQLEINQFSTYETITFTSKPGVFYVKIQLKGRGGMLEYTIFIEDMNNLIESNQPLTIYEKKNEISYRVQRLDPNYTVYNIKFFPIIIDFNEYQVSYYILESNRIDLLQKIEKCSGKYFIDSVNHHEEVVELKIRLSESDLLEAQEKGIPLEFLHKTSSPQNYITIVCILFNTKTQTYSHRMIPKYSKKKLTNGQLFSRILSFLSQLAIFTESYIDIHDSEKLVFILIVSALAFILLAGVIGGIWLGSKYCKKVKYVYVLRDSNNQQVNSQSTGMIESQEIQNEILQRNNLQPQQIS